MLDKQQKLHFIGIGGAGMSALAYILKKQGYEVAGSDLAETSLTAKLSQAGVKVFIGHDAANVPGKALVIISSAIKENNVELKEARRRRLAIWHRARLLAESLSQGISIAVSGTHGKTTTTSMISFILEKTGLDPTVLIGGEVTDIGGNARFGKGPYIVAEADESDGSFLQLHPVYAVVTNIEPEHLDYYKNYDHLLETFWEFITQISEHGKAILCADDAGIRKIMPLLKGSQTQSAESRFLSYSLKTRAQSDFTATDVTLTAWGSRFKFYLKDELLGEVELAVPGQHNVYNATAAIGLCLQLGLDFHRISSAIRHFRGAQRRFQLIGQPAGVTIVDDYGHHPTEVAATIKTARLVLNNGNDLKWTVLSKPSANRSGEPEPARPTNKGRLIVIFQPHRYTRTKYLGRNFAPSFQYADQVIITDIYSAGEAPIKGVNGKLIYDAVVHRGHPEAIYIPQKENVCHYILPRLRPGDLLLTIGAGDVWKVGWEIQGLLLKAIGRKPTEVWATIGET